ncbi:MAG TPA: hypothetical protein VGO49_07730 [Bradyrhizobium sp.]|nr:hypothetical protein [Bradyrhizobium sp.]
MIKQKTSVSKVIRGIASGMAGLGPKTEGITAVLDRKSALENPRSFAFRLLAYNSLQNDPLPFRTDHEYRRIPNAGRSPAAPAPGDFRFGRRARGTSNSIKNAIAITAMEGGRPSAFCLELLALYETGEISGGEMRKRMLERARS